MPSVLSTKALLFERLEKKQPVGNKPSDHEKIDQTILKIKSLKTSYLSCSPW